MDLFKVFKKHKDIPKIGERIISVDPEGKTVHKVVRNLSDAQKSALSTATLFVKTGDLFMHYWQEGLEKGASDDREWQEKAVFFWKASEKFPKKSLPEAFDKIKGRYFRFNEACDFSRLQVTRGLAAPWFGMSGGGEKFYCQEAGQMLSILELAERGWVDYFENVDFTELTGANLEILKQPENYFFHLNEDLLTFKEGNFHLEGKLIPIDVAYEIGALEIIKKLN